METVIEHYMNRLDSRRGALHQWCGTDNAESYREQHGNGPNPFKPEDFDYRFNSNGFRCDEFTEESELPVLFNGCSITEGIGVPVTGTWAYQLVEKLRAATGKKIPFWNIAIGGGGFDTMASSTMWFVKNVKVKPKLVFSLFPSMYRRDYCVETPNARMWAPALSKTNADWLFADTYFAQHQCTRSFNTIQAMYLHWNCQAFHSAWEPHAAELMRKIGENYVHFPVGKSVYTPRARDDLHPGVGAHADLCGAFWKVVEPKLHLL